MLEHKTVLSALLGVAVGDALGVPVEFKHREVLRKNPVTSMIGWGTHGQHPGTWSDDSSLMFCLAESLVLGYNLHDIAERFILWKHEAHWSARGDVFDIGRTTSKAIERLVHIIQNNDNPSEKLANLGGTEEEMENGNGSLMRILPLMFMIKGMPVAEQFRYCWEVSALTHRHVRAALTCFFYIRIAEHILNGASKNEAYIAACQIVKSWIETDSIYQNELPYLSRILSGTIAECDEAEIASGGYVIDSIEASVWAFLRYDSFEKIVLGAVNLGHDTDTTGAIAGGLAGLYYGYESMPPVWLANLARLEDIAELAEQLETKYF